MTEEKIEGIKKPTEENKLRANRAAIMAYPTEPFIVSVYDTNELVAMDAYTGITELEFALDEIVVFFPDISIVNVHGQKKYVEKIIGICKNKFDEKVDINYI